MSKKNRLANKAVRRELKSNNQKVANPNSHYKRITHWFTDLTSKKLVLLYIILILVFALVYFFIPSHFYHTTNKYEHYWKKEIATFTKSLEEEIREDFVNMHNTNQIELLENRVTFNIDSSGVYDVEVEDSSISFGLACRMYSEGIWFPIFYNLELDLEADSFSDNPNESIKRINITKEGTKGLNEELKLFSGREVAFVQNNCSLPFAEAENTITFSKETEKQFQNLLSASKGFPAYTTGTFFRMLYLSATTITTLGLGDITPISNISRLLITLETILGIVFMGLYVNTLYTKFETSLKSSSS